MAPRAGTLDSGRGRMAGSSQQPIAAATGEELARLELGPEQQDAIRSWRGSRPTRAERTNAPLVCYSLPARRGRSESELEDVAAAAAGRKI